MNIRNFNFIVLTLILIIAPINLFQSGLPQVHHYLFLFFFLNFVFYYDKLIELIKENKYIIIFFLYTLLINIFWYIIDFEFSYIKGVVYNFFNLLVFLSILIVLNNNKDFLKNINKGLCASVLIQYFIYFIFMIIHYEIYAEIYELDRLDLLSKSKNTLGFVLLFFSIIVFINFHNRVNFFNFIFKYILIILIAYLLISNRSLGAIFGFVILLIFILSHDLYFLFKKNFLFFLCSFIFILIFFILTYNLYQTYFEHSFINLTYTLSTLGSRNDESFIGRGYGILFQHPEMLVFGAGDTDVINKFNVKVSIHSFIAHLIFAYGVIGGLFLFLHLLNTIRKNFIFIFIITFSLLPFLMTHNTMKNSFFWFIFALLSYIGKKKIL